MTPAEYLRLPYHRRAFPDGDKFTAEIVEFPGCFATGDSEGEALKILEEVAECWLAAVIEQGQSVPEPSGEDG